MNKFKFFGLVLVLGIGGIVLWVVKSHEQKYQIITSYDYSVPVTNSWLSALFFEKFGRTLFTYPGSYRLTQKGVEISKLVPNFSEKSIIAPHNPELFLTSNSKIIDKEIVGVGQWDIRLNLISTLNDKTPVHIVKGSAAIYFGAGLGLSGEISEISKINDGQVQIKTTRQHQFLAGSDKALFINGKSVEFDKYSRTNYVVILPDNFDGQNLDRISACAANEPEFTEYSFEKSGDKFRVNYKFGRRGEYLFASWPHQGVNGNLGSYSTPRGELGLVCGNGLSVSISVANLPLSWNEVVLKSKLKDQETKDLLLSDIKDLENRSIPQGVYFRGKYLKDMADMWEITGLLGLKDYRDSLEGKLKVLLLEDLENFSRDEKLGVVVYKFPEFGNEKGNDHHFQYSYHIYAYSKLFDTFDTEERVKVQDVMNLLVNEGMPGLKKKPDYPLKFRFLDAMEAHSWADGQALFEDGNNQESTSEALFYWYSLYLWGNATDDRKISGWAQFAYSLELSGQQAYWLLKENRLLTNEFSKPILSLIWGGKADYGTWFSPDEDKILGIQLLPINPSSFVSLKLTDEVVKKRIFDYYNGYFGADPQTSTFGYYYLVFKKINGFGVETEVKPQKTEFFSRALLHLLPN